MKKFFLIVSLFFCVSIHAQTSYHYQFKLNHVTNLAEAKDITDPIRFYFKTYPTFNDVTDYFEFNSDVNATQAQLTSLLNSYSYTILDFTMHLNGSQPATTTTPQQ